MLARHFNHIARALKVAETSDHWKWYLGAVIAKGNRVVATGSNKFRNMPHVDHTNSSMHAEIAAIKAAGNKDLRGTTIYVARVGKNGHAGLARPCNNCYTAIVNAGIKEIVYTNLTGNISEERV